MTVNRGWFYFPKSISVPLYVFNVISGSRSFSDPEDEKLGETATIEIPLTDEMDETIFPTDLSTDLPTDLPTDLNDLSHMRLDHSSTDLTGVLSGEVDSSGVYICKSIVNYLRHGKLHIGCSEKS